MSITVLIADDHQVVRAGLASLLEGAGMKVVAQAENGEQALALAKKHRPDLALLDIRMPESDGLSVLREICDLSPKPRVVVLSTYDNPTYLARAHALGAADYLLKGCTREQLLSSLNAVHAGESMTSQGQLHRVADSMQTKTKDDTNDLTLRETQVLRHLALGLSNKEIGLSLDISVETVKEHVQHVLRKLNLTDRTQAAVWAAQRGMA